MTATFLAILALFSTALLFGGMTFFSAVLAPSLFMNLDKAAAGQLLRTVFPVYYLTIAILAAIAAGALIDLRTLDASLMAAVCLAALVARFWLMPRINRQRDRAQQGDAAAEAAFQRDHKLSVTINLAQILASAFALLRFVI